MQFEKTSNGFNCIITANELAAHGINYDDINECQPTNPKYRMLIQSAIQAAIQQKIITLSTMAAIDCCQKRDEQNRSVIMTFDISGEIDVSDMPHMTTDDRQELMQAMHENPELNPAVQQGFDKKLIDALEDRLEEIYYKNHPEAHIEKAEAEKTGIDFLLECRHLSEVIKLCQMLPDIKYVDSVLYKYNSRYYLLLHISADKFNKKIATTIDMTAAESDARLVLDKSPRIGSIKEHGDIICKEHVVSILRNL